jgi:ABC-2 type transport system ATP-binding protein
MAAVITSGLTKNYDGVRALDSVDLNVGAGEVRGLLGPNGAGKTTLLRILLGLVEPEDGTIELFGETLATARHGIPGDVAGFVEEPAFYPYLSGRANLEVLAELDGERTASAIDGVLDRVDLAARAKERVAGYSSGMRQRLGIAAALMRRPRLLLLDEPTSGLDPEGIRFVGGLLGDLAREGTTVLLSSHLIGELEGLCDSFTILDRGRMVWQGSSAELRARAQGSAYLIATSDDRRASELAAGQPGVELGSVPEGGLSITAEQDALDSFVLTLASSGIAVRHLALSMNPLESAFFSLTGRPREPQPQAESG